MQEERGRSQRKNEREIERERVKGRNRTLERYKEYHGGEAQTLLK